MKKSESGGEAVSGILRDCRIEMGYTQRKIAEYLHIDRTTYAKYENGRKPEIDVVILLAKLYGISVSEILGDYCPDTRGTKKTLTASAPKPKEDKLVRLSLDEQRLIEYYRSSDAKSSIVEFARKIHLEELAQDNKTED
ncbi:MAG: helix-turn-helix transcriptional regulator [Clostridia bacterium]|nr:helix-turn-helix transcriptional regulator [Clostridia bacterium]